MNLELARVAARRVGAVIVDSTRLGKAFPDSMTATVRERQIEGVEWRGKDRRDKKKGGMERRGEEKRGKK